MKGAVAQPQAVSSKNDPSFRKNIFFCFSHVENKHVDCFQYKCPGCRTTKTSRLAFDCHTRSRHAAARNTMLPLLRLKRQFSVKNSATAAASSPEKKENKGYDLHFVTFLRLVAPCILFLSVLKQIF